MKIKTKIPMVSEAFNKRLICINKGQTKCYVKYLVKRE